MACCVCVLLVCLPWLLVASLVLQLLMLSPHALSLEARPVVTLMPQADGDGDLLVGGV